MSVKQANLPDSLIGPCLVPRMVYIGLQKAGLIILSSHQFSSSALASRLQSQMEEERFYLQFLARYN